MTAGEANVAGMGAGAVPGHVDPARVVDWDYLRDPRLPQDPYKLFHDWIEEAPAEIVWTTANGGHWMVMRQEAILEALQTPERFSSRYTTIPPVNRTKLIPEELDPPEHTKYRAVLARRLGPKMMKFFDERARVLARDLIARVEHRGEADLMDALTVPMPCALFLEMVGLPTERTREFVRWKDELFKGTPEQRAHANERINVLIAQSIEEKRATPGGPDLMSFLIHEARIDGAPVSQDDLMAYGFLFFIAGLDTVTSLMTACFAHLAQNPDKRDELLANRKIIPDFIEEILRRFGVVNMIRTAACDFAWRGIQVRAGDQFVCSSIIADLDRREFPNPMTIDFEREDNRHIGFGGGPHRCAGSHLARTELIAVFEEVLPRLKNLRLKPGTVLEYDAGSLISLKHLPVQWDLPSQNPPQT
nr:cytochrome P450 [Sphingomonas sp. CDS-1]